MTQLKKARIKNGLTRQELAKKVGISTRAIEYYESLEREPRAGILKKIADVLECRMEDLI